MAHLALLVYSLCLIGCFQESSLPPTPSLSTNTTPQSEVSRVRGYWTTGNVLFQGVLTTTYADGSTRSYIEVKDGKKHGVEWHFSNTGKVQEHRQNHHGLRVGIHKGWWPTGSLRFQYSYQVGLLEGEALDWYPSGELRKKFHYSQGKELGLQEIWGRQGKVLAHYEYKEGRRYGKVPTQICEGKVP